MQTAAYERITQLLAQPPSRVHFVGVGGVGMAGLALLLARKGWSVSGCDAEAGPMLCWLAEAGVAAVAGHSPDHASGLDPARDWIVRTPAVPPSHPELVAAAARGLPVFDRGVVLAALFDTMPSTVAICGSHGKTTTATFTTLLLRALGRTPGWCIGGTSSALGGVAGVDASAPEAPFVAECDESDGTLSLYHPRVTVVTNIDYDHMEHFGSCAAFEAVFAKVARQTRGTLVYVRDDERAHALCHGVRGAVTVGLHPEADLRAEDVTAFPDASEFTLWWKRQSLGRWRLGAPGLHNVRNALAALGAVHALGGDLAAAAACLAAGLGLPARRFDCVSDRGGIRVVTDYAHHPAEIAALVATARLQACQRIVAVFQPHRYSRTLALGPLFPAAFAGVDALALAPVYAASETPLEGGSSADLYVRFREAAGRSPEIPVPALARTLEDAWTWLRMTVRPGDLVLLVGAGDIVRLAPRTAGDPPWSLSAPEFPVTDGLAFEPNVDTARWVTYGAGGTALGMARVASPVALAELVRACARRKLPWQVLGMGSNTLVPDTGYPGILIRLDGAGFRTLERDPDRPGRVMAGAGWPGAALLNQLQALGLGGLEFLDSIPGTLGGWLAMNAGAHGGAVGDALEAVEVLDADGRIEWIPASALGLGYRRCEALRTRVALAARWVLPARSPSEIAALRAGFRAKRIDLSGLRTAGSVFKNPPGDSAGRLLDLAGCKGMRVGGAEVTSRHANVIAAFPGTTASDILALAFRASQRVAVPLDLEVRVLDGCQLR